MVRCLLLLVCVSLLCACGDTKKSDLNGWVANIKFTGGLRMERMPADAPFDRATLARNFRKIAYDVERNPFGFGLGVPQSGGHPMLKRWETDIQMQVVHDEATAATAWIETQSFMEKLSGLTNVPAQVSVSDQIESADETQPNFLVFLGTGEFFEVAIAELNAASQSEDEDEAGISASFLEFFGIWHESYSPCAGQNYTEDDEGRDTGRIFLAIVAIRTDLDDPMTQSCIEEELAQSMGLMNDDDDVRPSLFNDDNEFALMTSHDELLLRILYDKRLRAGMTPEQSMPTVRKIAVELMSGS